LISKSKIALLITLLATLAIAFLIYLEIMTLNIGYSILIGISIATINFLLFIGAYAYSIKKTNKTFLIFNLGGMGIRLLIMLSLVFISIKILKVGLLGFIFALFIWYIFFLIFEIAIVRRGMEGR
jgi:F0F1-type ATP synthase assembly protein I